jgi:Domain of unknown function (DUF4815)
MTFPIALNVAPYFDDANTAIDDNYVQVLFKPSFAVQARELTQIQDILQNQISQLGEFVLADGSPVSGGHISVDGSATAITLQQQFSNTDINLSDFFVNSEPTLIINATGNTIIKAVVIGVDTTQVNPVIVVKYMTGTTFADGAVIQVATGVQTQAQLAANNSSSPASIASISAGVFFSGGYFVNVDPATIVLSSSNSAPSALVGLEIQADIINSGQDSSLLDPAQGAFNFQAPGADRAQYNLVLSSRSFTSTDTTQFYSLLTLENGLVTSQVEYPILGTINNTLAKRTYDTNGDFVVKPFIITTGVNQANAEQYAISVSPGEAFVKGFEFQTVGSQTLFADKALDTNSVTDYTFSLEFGNILTTANLFGGSVSGSFNIAGYQNVDVHCVASGQIVNGPFGGDYQATKIGTARIRDIETNGTGGSYFTYVIDVNITPNTFVAITGSSNNFTFPTAYSNIAANAYANVLCTVTTGGFVDQATILSYNNANRIATLDKLLSTPANSTSNISLNFGVKDIDCLVIQPSSVGNTYFTQQAANAFDACMDISFLGRDINGNTILQDTQFNNLIYPLPQSPIEQNSIENASFGARNCLLNQSFANTSLTISSGSGLGTQQNFPFGFQNQLLPDSVATENFVVVVRNALTSNLTNGQVLVMNRNQLGGAGGNGVFQVDTTHITIATSASAAFFGDVYFTVSQANASTSVRRTKSLFGNTSNTVLASTDSFVNAANVIGLTGLSTNNVKIDTANGYVWFLNAATMATTPGSNQSLYLPDVFNVIKVYDSGNINFAPNNTNSIDITQNYTLNSGQNDNYYDWASLTLKAGSNAPTGQTVVMLQYFAHTTSPGFFDADSYSSQVYNSQLIPYYNSPAFGTFSLRDSIDFRPTRQLGSVSTVANFTTNGLELPNPDSVFTLSYSFFLPRIDKLVLNKGGVFQIIEGISSQFPVAPADARDAMTLYILSVPAFTANVQQISLQYVENKRYTMADIGALDGRITQLELQSNLSALEQQATSETILYQDGVTAKDQYGVIADSFGDFSVVDNQTTDLRCYLQEGTLSPFKATIPLALEFSSNSAPFQKNERTYTLPWTEVPAVIQNTATVAVTVQPYLFAQFTGTINLTPETDYWFSETLSPQLIAPPTANPAMPPLPKPTQAPALIPSANVAPPSPPIVAGTSVAITDFWFVPDIYWYDTSVGFTYIEVQVGSTSYGVVSAVTNWFGTPTAAAATASSHPTNIPQTGSAIQLPSGSSITNSTTISPSQIKAL